MPPNSAAASAPAAASKAPSPATAATTPAPPTTPGARDIYRDVPNSWIEDGVRCPPINTWGTVASGSEFELRLSWNPPLTPKQFADATKNFRGENGHALAREQPTRAARENEDWTPARVVDGAAGEVAEVLADHGQIRDSLIGAIPKRVEKIVESEKIDGVLGKYRGRLCGSDFKAFWDEYCSGPGNYWVCRELGAGGVNKVFLVQVESMPRLRPLAKYDVKSAEKLQGSRPWTRAVEDEISANKTVQKEREEVGGENWRWFVWVRVVPVDMSRYDQGDMNAFLNPLSGTNMRLPRWKIMKFLDGSAPRKVRNEAGLPLAASLGGASSSGAAGPSASGAAVGLAPVRPAGRRAKLDRLLALLSRLSFPVKSQDTTPGKFQNFDTEEQEYLTWGVTGRARNLVSHGNEYEGGEEILRLALEVAAEMAKEKKLDGFCCSAVNVAKNMRTPLHIDCGMNIKESMNYQFTLGNYKDPGWKTVNQGRTFVAYTDQLPQGKYGVSAAGGAAPVSSSKATTAPKPSPKAKAAPAKAAVDHHQTKAGRKVDAVAIAGNSRSLKRFWIADGTEIEGYYVDSFEMLIEFPATTVPHATEAFVGHRYNITFYSVALLTSDPELRAKQVLHLEQLGFPLPQDPSFRVSAADRKKYGKDVGNYVQNARAYDFNRMEGSPGGSSGPAMKRAKRD